MKYFFVLILTISSVSVKGQNQHIGVKLGPGFSNVLSDYGSLDFEFRIGYNAGISYKYLTSGKLVLGADLLYTQKGYRDYLQYTDEYGENLFETRIKVNHNYISLPLKAGLRFGNDFSFFMSMGLVPEVNIYAKAKQDGGLRYYEFDMKPLLKNFVLSGLLEFGILWRVTDHYSFSTDINLQHGLMSYVDNEAAIGDSFWQYGAFTYFGMFYRF